MNRENFIKGTEDDYTHIKFTYSSGMTMIVNKSTYKHVYPREKQIASKFEYLIEKQDRHLSSQLKPNNNGTYRHANKININFKN